MKAIAIVLMCVGAAIGYGILHDEVTARICVEYFTVGHPDLFGTDSPTLLGIGWGIVATWWAGLLLGIPLAVAARLGPRPKLTARDLARPVGRLLLVMACGAAIVGLAGFVAARQHWVYLAGEMASAVSASQQQAFLVALWMHTASYAVGFLGGAFLSLQTWRRRQSLV